MHMLTLVAALLLNVAAVPAQSTNLTGKWTGTFTRTAPDGQTQTLNVIFDLVQKGKVLTGTVGPTPERQWPIEKGGSVDAGKITFKVVQPEGPTMRTFTLKLVKDRLQGEMHAERGGESITAKVDAGRAKDK